jgi:hypothetical protein
VHIFRHFLSPAEVLGGVLGSDDAVGMLVGAFGGSAIAVAPSESADRSAVSKRGRSRLRRSLRDSLALGAVRTRQEPDPRLVTVGAANVVIVGVGNNPFGVAEGSYVH